ncbi:hypothetical protein EHP00_1872 [Ecytonucleospora hepatopenaei]|uniref:Uncharacterized protein n=1 Tax=Ecytonucleospora hepatopenaei TaxID=646526 RepID=A0A1W0E8B9_9MICR|nr:hypothetical protein EHP00_1872 [Ecytonucleospora hepatopenaei]
MLFSLTFIKFINSASNHGSSFSSKVKQNPDLSSDPDIKQENENIFIEIEKSKIGDNLPSGGTKEVFKYGEDKVLSFLSLPLIKNELEIIEDLKKLKLETQNAQLGRLVENGIEKWAIVMESWDAMQKRGLQVRDCNNPSSRYGTSMLFKKLENFTVDNLLTILRPIMEECFTLITNGICLNCDSYNIVIKDTKDTDTSDRKEYKIYTERNQEVKLFFNDFTGIKFYEFWKKENLKDMIKVDKNTNGETTFQIDDDRINHNLLYFFNLNCESAILNALLPEESNLFKNKGVNFFGFKERKILEQAFEILNPELFKKIKEHFEKQLRENEEFKKFLLSE